MGMSRPWQGTEPWKLLLWRQRNCFKFHYTSRNKAVNRQSCSHRVSWQHKPLSIPAMTTTRKTHHRFVTVSILITNSKRQPQEQTETHCKPTDLNASQFRKRLDMNFTVQARLLNRTRRGHSSTNSTDTTKYKLLLMFCGDVMEFRWLKDNLDRDSCQFHLVWVQHYILGTRKPERCFRWMKKAKQCPFFIFLKAHRTLRI